MRYSYKDQLDGYFAISTADQWLEKYQNQPLPHYCILLNFGAPMLLTKDFKNFQLEPQDICFMSPGTYISAIQMMDQQHWFVEFNTAFYCLELHDKELSCDGLLFGALPDLPILNTNDQQATNNLHLIDIFKEELEKDDSTKGDMLKLLLKRLIIKCVRLGKEQLFNEQEPPDEETDIIRKYQALVEKYFRSKQKVADYAELLFKSPKTLSNTFKKLHTATPLQIIQERIVLEAKRQLFYTDKSIKEITFELGFTEPAQFSRLFKNVVGISPSEFQKRQLV